jgi:hypothetical protein
MVSKCIQDSISYENVYFGAFMLQKNNSPTKDLAKKHTVICL